MTTMIALMGSPRRKGNSDILLDEFLIGVKKAGGAFEKIFLNDLKITACREDHKCAKTGECPLADDAAAVFQKILAAEKLVVAAPVFFGGLPSHLKALVDRVESFWIRKYILKQTPPAPLRKGFVIMVGATQADKLFEGCLLTLRYFFQTLNVSIHGSLLYRGIEKPEDLTPRPSILAEVREAGRKFVEV